MKSKHLLFIIVLLITELINAESIQKFGVKPTNSPEVNKKNLQMAIDRMSTTGGVLFVDPTDVPYRIAGGIILRKNVSLVGANAATPRGTCHPLKRHPVVSVFQITDKENVFITVESATQIKGIQFWYSEQATKDPAKIIEYPPTIRLSYDETTQGVTLNNLTFYGEYLAIDFAAPEGKMSELLTAEHCFGYSLSGIFIRVDRCYDIPRILHCHSNPATNRLFAGGFSSEIVDAVIAKKMIQLILWNKPLMKLMKTEHIKIF